MVSTQYMSIHLSFPHKTKEIIETFLSKCYSILLSHSNAENSLLKSNI